jgi:Flp pilus assembly protein TadD
MLNQQPSDSEVNYLLGQAYARLGNADKAREFLDRHEQLRTIRVEIHRLERVAGRYPNDVESRRRLASLYHQLGLEDQARYWQRSAEAVH